MSDLQCPVRVHLDGGGAGDRVATVLRRPGAAAPAVVAELADLADLHRGEAVVVVLPEDVRREVARRLVGDPDATVVEGDADGWRSVSGPRAGRGPGRAGRGGPAGPTISP